MPKPMSALEFVRGRRHQIALVLCGVGISLASRAFPDTIAPHATIGAALRGISSNFIALFGSVLTVTGIFWTLKADRAEYRLTRLRRVAYMSVLMFGALTMFALAASTMYCLWNAWLRNGGRWG